MSRALHLLVLATFWAMPLLAAAPANAAPCLIVTLTGTQSGPPAFAGLAGSGTLVRYGDETNNCSDLKLQFDAGRGTNMRLSQIGVGPGQLDAVFFTHMHSDHTEGFPDVAFLRWLFDSKKPKLEVVCSGDSPTPQGFVVSCRKFVQHIGDAFLESGEIADRRSGDQSRPAGGPAEVTKVVTFEPQKEAQVVWSRGDVKVSAVKSTHMAGHASYRVDTPAGSIVIGGDAGNDVMAPPRMASTSDEVEVLAKGADIIVHSAIHPVLGPDRGKAMAPAIFYRQSTVPDLGAMARRTGAKVLMLTHLSPPLGAERQGGILIPGGPLTEEDFRKAVEPSGFTGTVIIGTDLASVRLPAKN
jgi:ribonuclease Z